MRWLAIAAALGLTAHYGYIAAVAQLRRFRSWLESLDFVAIILIAVLCVAIYLEGK